MVGRLLAPPFLEFGFWFEERPDREVLIDVAQAVLTLGGTWGAKSFVHSESDTRRAFAGTTDFPTSAQAIVGSLDSHETDKQRLVAVEMFEPGGGHAVVTFGRTEVPVFEGHTVQLWLSGDEFHGGLRRPAPEGVRKVDLFREVVELLDPSYAAISLDWPLATPQGFLNPASAGGFRDFYFSERFGGPAAIERILGSCASAAQGVVGGVIVMTSPWLGAAGDDERLGAQAAAVLRKEVLSASAGSRYR